MWLKGFATEEWGVLWFAVSAGSRFVGNVLGFVVLNGIASDWDLGVNVSGLGSA